MVSNNITEFKKIQQYANLIKKQKKQTGRPTTINICIDHWKIIVLIKMRTCSSK